MSGFIEIQTPDQTFEHRPAPRCVLTLRIVPDDVEKKLRKEATGKPKWVRGRHTEPFDAHRFLAAVLDYSIVAWSGVRANGAELECTPANKLLLPEALKLEINRMCLGKEGPDAQDEDDAAPVDEKNG